jgi:glycosyltransferase involved in cell wall biosynthesis
LTDVSIAAVIPLYNGSEFIEEAIRSVFAQTEPVDEIVVVNDGSQDDGAEIVEGLCRLHPITLLRKPNGGQSSARNFAINHTRCSHVAFLDQDDIWYEDHIERLKNPFVDAKTRNLAVVYGNLDQIGRKGSMIAHRVLDTVPTPQPKTTLQQCLEHDMFMLPSASLVSKEAIEAVGFFDERLIGYEDDDLFVRMFSAGYRFVYLNDVVTKWRIYGSSTSFGPAMARSRLAYFRKQIAAHPDDPGLGVFWTRDVIGPRFMRTALNELIKATKSRDFAGVKSALADTQEIAPIMNGRPRRRIRTSAPVMRALSQARLYGFARSLARRAMRF